MSVQGERHWSDVKPTLCNSRLLLTGADVARKRNKEPRGGRRPNVISALYFLVRTLWYIELRPRRTKHGEARTRWLKTPPAPRRQEAIIRPSFTCIPPSRYHYGDAENHNLSALPSARSRHCIPAETDRPRRHQWSFRSPWCVFTPLCTPGSAQLPGRIDHFGNLFIGLRVM